VGGDHKIPALIRAVAERAGYPAALALCRHYGGVRLYVPHRLDAEHRIATAIGVEALAVLIDLHRGRVIEIPLNAVLLRAERNRVIREQYDGGAVASTLARQFGLTMRAIFRILGQSDEDEPTQPGQRRDSRQMSLFDPPMK